MEFAAITFVGPGELERSRLIDLLDSLFYYEPQINNLVIIDDASGHDLLQLVKAPATCKLTVLPNPRNQKGDWWSGGLAVALATSIRWLAQNTQNDFAVRLDTDALVISPFAEAIRSQFQQNPNLGLIGTYQKSPQGTDLGRTETQALMKYVIPKLMQPLTLWRHSKHGTRLQCGLFKSDRLVARLAKTALSNGYQFGEFVQGGGYALSGELIRRAEQADFVCDPLAFLPMYFSEDHLATLLCFGTNLAPGSFNAKGEVFGVCRAELFTSPEQLRSMNYSIIHSIKSTVEGKEQADRDWFKQFRR